jgi:hypothetical protein
VKWEYTRYTILIGVGPTPFYTIHAPEQTIEDNSAQGLAEKLTGEPLSSKQAPLDEIFNYLGKLGWELIATDSSRGSISEYTYYFKRQIVN